jgi:hypothetical protein
MFADQHRRFLAASSPQEFKRLIVGYDALEGDKDAQRELVKATLARWTSIRQVIIITPRIVGMQALTFGSMQHSARTGPRDRKWHTDRPESSSSLNAFKSQCD